ncbi:MAG: trypsin-like peptidase domain-containing protein [bacterium]|nr:trypsin-like peptidase domain-containing protein [bacterium]
MNRLSPAATASLAVGLTLAAVCAQGSINPTLLQAPDTPAAADSGPIAIYSRARASVVHVYIEIDGPRGKFKIERASSGVIVDASGLVLTFHHLVAELAGATDKELFVQLDDAKNSQVPARVVRSDPKTGLALLAIDPAVAGGKLPVIELGADAPPPGETCLLIARPDGKDMLAFAGVTSAALAPVSQRGAMLTPEQCFLTDARNDVRGDGGPVVGADGRLLGLFGNEHVQHKRFDPTGDMAQDYEFMSRPSYGVVVNAAAIRQAFAREFGASTVKNGSLKRAGQVRASATAVAVAKIAPAVVGVLADGVKLPSFAADPGNMRRRTGVGSGVVIGADGYVVTNAHVAGDGAATVLVNGGKRYPAKVVRQTGGSNLALLKVDLPGGVKLPVAECAPDQDIVRAETVLAVARPSGDGVLVSGGVVSAIRRGGSRIQADADLGDANAGGAVVDINGRLLGVVDGGQFDMLRMQLMMRGDRVTKETNLDTFVSMRTIRRAFASHVEGGGTLKAPPATDPATRATPLTRMIEAQANAMLNIYIAENVAAAPEPDPDEIEDPFAESTPPELRGVSLGSGVIIDESGLAISNWHVVDASVNPDGSPRRDHVVTAKTFDGKEYDVEVLSISREDDLSLIRLKLKPGEKVHAIELGSSSDLRIGEGVAALGNPHGADNTITYGIVSKKQHFTRVRGRWAKLGPLIETDAAINGGNSGGALVDMRGRLVGINSAGGGTFTNTGFAIEVDHVRDVVINKLFSPYKLRSADLGLRTLDDEGKVLVMSVDDRGPAARAGVREGDRIVGLGGVEITWGPGFAMALRQLPAGVPVELAIERGGARQSFTIAPIDYAAWNVVQQASFEASTFEFREAPDRVRRACIALHRLFTGSATAVPAVIPETVVKVDRVFRGRGEFELALQPEDLLLAVELADEYDGDPVQIRFERLEQIRDLFNDKKLGKKDGVDHYKVPAEYKFWVARGGKVLPIIVRARRLLW